MKKRRELETTVVGMYVKRFNHYLSSMADVLETASVALAGTSNSCLDSLADMTANTLREKLAGERGATWVRDIKIHMETGARTLNRASKVLDDEIHSLRGEQLMVRFLLDYTMYHHGVGNLGTMESNSREHLALLHLKGIAHTLTTAQGDLRHSVNYVMEQSRTLGHIGNRCYHIHQGHALWQRALELAIRVVTYVLSNPEIQALDSYANMVPSVKWLQEQVEGGHESTVSA